ncbi:peptide/nickel transport system substrate-binding protein [Streptosporangium canum]|uniref:Peptide/nickel transport system substrate-binding protein n=1 Tax=Streptosporangium canum TaxID=324952 RepID=A0A1I3JZF0_9ACTN|nr:ABC transporter substrate-binding protein [Streptosporangium canum]SFI65534.1 peptide/nickel transport system substrate-binding protein [Streptosporangium canum]
MSLKTTVGTCLLAAALLSVSTACGGGKAPASQGSGEASQPSTGAAGKGGTLTILSNQDFAHLDPTRNWTMPEMDFGLRYLYRSLVTYKAEPGAASLAVVPDLATTTGEMSDEGKTWTFTLKDGLKYEDGSPIVAADVKYNVERSFAPELPGGPNYARLVLKDAEKYKGPYKDGSLKSIETPDDRTIVFRLKRPVAEFPYYTTLPTFAPVPRAKDTKAQYDSRVFSSGPYKIDTYDRGKELVLSRNEHWDPATDQVRKALPDKVVVKQGLRQSVIVDRLIADQGDDRTAVTYADVNGESFSKILTNPKVKARFHNEIRGCTDTLAMNNTMAPFDNPKFRLALQYAIDKESYQTTQGGPAAGEIATAFLPPSLSGGVAQDTLKIPATGDVERAKALIAESGVATPVKIKMYASTGDKVAATAIQESLKRVGVETEINTFDPSVFYDTIGDTAKFDGMALYGWCQDYPSGSSFIPMMFDGRTITDKGNSGNMSLFKDQETMDRIDAIYAMTDLKAADRAWVDLDAAIMQKAPMIPLVWARKPLLAGSKVGGAFGHLIWSGQFDYATLGIRK